MPVGFENCIKRGGRVRAKKLSGGRFIRICFKDGKSFPGEVHKGKKESQSTDIKEETKIEILENQNLSWIAESLSFEEKEGIDGLNVTYTVAEAGVSSNNRRYKTKNLAEQKLKGLKMFTDHYYEADNAVGIIQDSWMKGRKLMATALIKNSHKHPDIVEMIKDGRIDSVSLGGTGDVKKVKEKDKMIDEIQNLEVKEVSFVGIPGVSRAKVTKIGG